MAKVKYVLNDPLVPINLDLPLPAAPDMKISVLGLTQNANPDPGTVEYQALQAYMTVAGVIPARQKVIARSGTQLVKWSSTPVLQVNCRAGKQLNAFYDRRGLKFFYYPVGSHTLYLVDSTDVVAHELGHAILDAIRPDFFSVQALEIWAFHEAFGDVNAMIWMMEFPQAIEQALAETKGNLRQSNVITKLADQVGVAVFGREHPYLRDAVNTFKYVDPKTLPNDGDDNQLIAECHSFGRVFVGVWWDIVCGIYEMECKRVDPAAALVIAKNVAADYMYKAIVQVPRTSQFHYAIAQGMIVADKANDSKYADVLATAFAGRNMTPPQVTALAEMHVKDLKVKKTDVVTKRGKTTSVVVKSKKTIRLLDHHDANKLSMLSVDAGDLADVKMEVAFDTYYEFNEQGMLQHQITPVEDDVVEDARQCAMFIAQKDHLGKGKMWKVSRNKLVRHHIECPCCH